ncbi:MAG: hypothetical protein F6J86_43905 [Symploca sp. SIO1B1]|nr:hypothetical protein [Symploca sp. SIO1B1]
METQLTSYEIQAQQQLLQDYEPAQKAFAILAKNQGRLDASFDELWEEKNGISTYGKKSLWKVMLGEIRKELCGDDGFRGKVKEYTNNPGSAPLLTGLIVSLVGIAGANGLPIDPAIATIVVLYIVKIGLNTFCEYTESETNPLLPESKDK